MNLRNDLINFIEQGYDNKDIIHRLIYLEYKESDIIDELKDNLDEEMNTTKELFLESSLDKLRETIQWNNKFFKDINKHDIISSLQNFQSLHVKASNEAHRAKKNIDGLKQWVTEEMEKAELSAKVQTDEHIKGLFLGQKLSFERILRQIEDFK